MGSRSRQKLIVFGIILLIIVSLSVGFSAFQKSLYVDNMDFYVRLEDDVRVSNVHVSKTNSSAISNYEEYNVSKLIANVTLPNTSAYVLYKIDLTNYGNVKSGLLSITNNSNVNYSICNSNGSSCSSLSETPVCSGSDCTLGATKELYLKVSSNTAGTYDVNFDFDFEPYNTIEYYNINENISSFRTEIMSNDTYQLTLTSKPEVVEVNGSCTYTYNKSTGVLNISNIDSDLSINAKYLVNKIYSDYNTTNPSNYVRFNDTLYRMIAKDSVSDGYGNTETRVKIISNTSIGNNAFDQSSNDFASSEIKNILNNTYYEGLSSDAKDLVDTVAWTNDFTGYVGLIKSSDYTANSEWFNKYGFTLTQAENDKVVSVSVDGLIDTLPSASLATYPALYLKKDALIADGSGTESNPYILDISSGSEQTNPTRIVGKTQNVTGSNLELVTVSNKVGTVYYSRSTQLDSSNYTDGSTSIPTEKNAGTYVVYYYIPAGENYKAKSGRVTAHINPLTFQVTYVKGEHVSSTGKQADLCTTTGSSVTCSVTLPSITPDAGYRVVGWSDGTNNYNPGNTYTLSSNATLTASATGDTFVATFNANGATGIGETTLSCTVTTGSSCTVIAPSITREGFTISGWATSATATSGVQVGNPITLSESGTYYAVTSKTVTITFNKNGNTTQTPSGGAATTATTVTQSCTIQNNNTNCTVKSPTITTEGFTAIGYSNEASNHTSSWDQNTNKTVSENATYFAQTIKASKTITITFNKNGNASQIPSEGESSTANTITQSCTIPAVYNGDAQGETCNVTSPTIGTSNGYEAVGYSTEAGTHTSSWDQNTPKAIGENTTYFAQSKKLQSATFTLVDTNAATLSSTSSTCYTYNGVTGTCSLTAPTLTAKDGYIVDGWSLTNGGTTTTTTFTSGNTYYSVTHRGYTANFVLVDSNAATLSSTTASCSSYNGETSCTITPPTLTAKSGYTVVGWSTTNGGTTTTTTFTSGNTYYSVTRTSSAVQATFNIQDSNAATKTGGTTSCYKYNGASSCNITAPTLTAKTGYAVVGWNTSESATNSSLASGGTATISSNTTYYSITYNTTPLQGTFTIQDTNAATKTGGTTNCYRYNGSSSCTIVAPTLTSLTDYTVVGWNTNQNATTSSLSSGGTATISSNTTYYSITRTTASYKATFTNQDTNAATISGSAQPTCYKYNGASTCGVTAPTLTAKTGYTVVGWNTNQNATTSTVASGATVQISGNVTYYAITYASTAFKATFINQDNRAASIAGDNQPTCYVYNGASSCSVTAPTLTAKTGYAVVGWNTNENATSSTVNSGGTVSITANTTYYAITYNTTPIEVAFYIQDSEAATKSGGTTSCYKYNGSVSCTIVAPTLTPKAGYNAIGWSTVQNATTSSLNSGASIVLANNETYYSITRTANALNATFIIQDSNAATQSGGNTSCYKYNGALSCQVKSPTLSNKTGYTAIGWNTTSTATTATVGSNETFNIAGDVTYYSITRSSTALSATFNIQDENAATKSGGNTSCYKFNGATSCSITAPTLTANEGYTVIGWNTNQNATTSTLNSNASLTITSNTTYYSITRTTNPLNATFTVQDTDAAIKSGGTTSCYKFNGATSCVITAPILNANTGYTVVGWSTSENSQTSSLAPEASTTISTDTTYYSVTYNTTALVATFIIQDGNAATLSGNARPSCYRYNGASSCTITSPTLSRKTGYTMVGWNTSQNATTSTLDSNTDKDITADVTYYSVTYKTSPIQIEFEVQDENAATMSGGVTSCLRYNGATSCNITAPTLTANSGYAIVGWNTDNTASVSTFDPNTTQEKTSYQKYYSITYNTTPLTGTFTIQDTAAATMSGGATSCYKYNGGDSCRILTPTLTANSGYTALGWSTNPNATIASYSSNAYYSITSNTAYYSVTFKNNYQNTTTNTYYENLTSAFNNISSNETIKVLNNTTESNYSSLASTVTGAILDLNGKTITISYTSTSSTRGIRVNGSLDIYNSSSTPGTIKGDLDSIIDVIGTLTINGTSNTNTVIINDTKTTQKIGIFSSNNSTTVINSNVQISSLGNGLYVNGNVTINGATITGGNTAVHNDSGTVIVNDNSQITGNTLLGIENQTAGTLTMNGGTVNGVTAGIMNAGTATILGGTVTGINRGLTNSGTTTIGSDDGTVSTTSPLIQATGTSSNYGVSISSDKTFNFYDGVIKSASGTGYSIYGNITDMPDGYNVTKSTSNGIETAVLVEANYQNIATNSYYSTLQQAIDTASNNQTIKVINDKTETATITVPSDKSVKLDLNGNEVHVNTKALINNGNLEIINTSSEGGSISSGASVLISNNGTLKIGGNTSIGVVEVDYTNDMAADYYYAIDNSATGNVTIDDNFQCNATIIAFMRNYGTVTINKGYMVGGYTSLNYGDLIINGGTVRTGMTNAGTITLNGGTINTSSDYIANNNTGTINMNGGMIQTSALGIEAIITNYGTFNMTAGTISATNSDGILNGGNGTFTMTGGSVSGSGNGIKITNGSVTLGSNDGTVSKTSPSVTGGYGKYGVNIYSGKTFNFYDGIIRGNSTNLAINGTVTDIPDGYEINKVMVSGREVATLMKPNYLNTTTNVKYETLHEAFTAVSNDETIKVLNNTSEDQKGNLASGKTGVSLDLNGKTVTCSAMSGIDNRGELLIYNSSTTTATYVGTSGYAINNDGTLTINDASHNNPIVINGNATFPIVNNESTLNIGDNAQIIGDTSACLYNRDDGITTMNGGLISGSNPIKNSGSIVIGGTAQVVSTENNAIDNYKNVTINDNATISSAGIGIIGLTNASVITINGGTINADYNGIYADYGSCTVLGGTITGISEGITVKQATLTIGTDDGVVSTTSPVIQTIGTASIKGIYIYTTGTAAFYDGVIKSASGTGYAVGGSFSDIPDGYSVQTSTTNGVESAILFARNYQNTTTNVYYESLNDAFTGAANNQTIKVIENTHEDTIAELASGKTGIKLDLNGKTITLNVNNGIQNRGELDIYNSSSTIGTITGTNLRTVSNFGTLTTNATSSTYPILINNTYSSSAEAIRNNSTGTVTIKSNTQLRSVNGDALINFGTATIFDGTLSGQIAVDNQGTGTVTIKGGSLSGTTYGATNYGTATVTGGTISGQVASMTITGPTTVTGGSITGTGNGIDVGTSATLTIGNNDGSINTTSPLIETTGTSSKHGVGVTGSGVVNFYDGVIKSASGTNNAFYSYGGVTINTPTGYGINKTVSNGIESAILIEGNYYNVEKDSYYSTLNDAFSAVSNNQTIKVAQNVTETTAVTLASGKTGIKLDLNGKTITTSYTITNNGSLDIYSSSGNNGSIVSSENDALLNNGTLTINGTSTANKVTISSLLGNAIRIYAINNKASASVTIRANSVIESEFIAIRNYGTSNIQGASVYGGEIIIVNESGGTINISGSSTLTGDSSGIWNAGNLTITDGTVSSVNRPLENTSIGVITLGTNDSTVSTTSPILEATGTSQKYGVYTVSGGTFNFYDGVIKSASGAGYSIYGDVSNTPDGYDVNKTTTSGVESAILIIRNYQNTITGSYYETLGDAFSNAGNNQTIKVLKNITVTGSAELPSGKTGIKLDLNGKTITGGSASIIINNGELELLDSTSSSSSSLSGSYPVDNNGTLIINDITLQPTSFVKNAGTLTINSGSINGGTHGIFNSGTAIINGGTIGDASSNGIINNGGTSYIYGGTITGAHRGIGTQSGGSLIIGTDDNNVSKTTPVIEATGTTNSEGVYVAPGLTFEFYDGIIKSASGGGYSISGTISNLPAGYQVKKTTVNGIESAILINNNYLNTTTNESFETLKEAFAAVGNNQTIQVIKDTSENEQAVLASGKTGIKLDLNGKTVTVANLYEGGVDWALINNGELDIYNSSSTPGKFTTYSAQTIRSGGTLTINGTSTANTTIIENIDPNNISATVLNNMTTGTVRLYANGKIVGNDSDTAEGISNGGTFIIDGGTIESVHGGIYNYGTVTFNSGSITCSNNDGLFNSGILNEDTVNMIDGTISCGTGIDNYSTFNMTGGTVIGEYAHGIFSEYEEAPNAVVTITGGTVRGVETGIRIKNNTTVTIGSNDGTISNISPVIETTGTASKYGVYIYSGGIFNFYDGVIKSASGEGYSIYGAYNNTPTGYGISKSTTNGVESAVLGESSYINTTSNREYTSLSDAFVGAGSNETIKATKNVTEPVTVRVESGTTAKLDLNGKTITLAGDQYGMRNMGTLDIYNSSSTQGILTGAMEATIFNTGTLTLNGTSTTNPILIRNTGTTSTYKTLLNNPSKNITINNNATVQSTNSRGILNHGVLTLNGGTVTASDAAINNQAQGSLTMSSGILNSSGYYGLLNMGTATVTGGSITGASYGIHTNASSVTTLGTNDSTVSKASPVISTSGTSNKYGVYIYSGATFNYYDGIISSASGTGYSLYGTVSDTPSGYEPNETTTSGVSSTVLVQKNYLNTSTNEFYGTLNEAFAEVSNNQTIKVFKDNTEIETATLANSKSGIKLDLNGKTVTGNVEPIIRNNGELDIYNTSGTQGTIECGLATLIYNSGILTLNGTATSNNIIIHNTHPSFGEGVTNSSTGLITVNNNATIISDNGVGINNNHYTTSSLGTISINGGTITSLNRGGINNSGFVILNNGSITGYSYGIQNNDSGSITMYNGTVTSQNDSGINSSGTSVITGGTITGVSHGLRTNGTGVTTIGINDSTISTSSPLIQTTGTSSKYGVYTESTATFNFYDGVIKSASGTGYSIYGSPSDVPNGYGIDRTTTNNIESATLIPANYVNTSTYGGYSSLADALEEATNNQTIVVRSNTTESSQITVPSGLTGVKLDLNGKTITSSAAVAIVNNGELDIYNSSSTAASIIGSGTETIQNKGTLSINGTSSANKVTITSTSSDATSIIVTNASSSQLTINNNTEITNSVGVGLTNSGTLTMNGGTIYGEEYGLKSSNGTATLTGATITSVNNHAIENRYGTMTISGGTITSSFTTLYNYYSGIVNINNNAQIISTDKDAVENWNTINVTSATITGFTCGIYSRYGNVTLGTNDGTVSTTAPSVEATATTGNAGKNGIYLGGGSKLYYYDGVVKAALQGKAIYGNVTETPSGYDCKDSIIDGAYAITLVVPSEYQNTTTSVKYASLKTALANVESNQTIKVLKNVTELTSGTLASGITGVKLDLNGKTVTCENATCISNNGTLDVYNTSSTTGTLATNGSDVISNAGTLTLNGTSTTNTIVLKQTATTVKNTIYSAESTSLTINNNVKIQNDNGNGVSNRGAFTMTGGIITSKSTALNNQSTGTIAISGSAQITSTNSGAISDSGGTVTITGGTIAGKNAGIGSAGTLSISGSTQITSSERYAIYISSGSATITGGTITGYTYGIYLMDSNCSLTLGVNNSSVSTTSPSIQSTSTSNGYGIYNSSGTFNFYDGVIKSSSGSGKSISGTVTATPSGYTVKKTTSNGVETAILSK